MTDSNWQLAVLRDLGATQRGFADTAPAEPRPAAAQAPDPGDIAGTAQVAARSPEPDPATGTGGFPGLPASGTPAAPGLPTSGTSGLPASGPPGAPASGAPGAPGLPASGAPGAPGAPVSGMPGGSGTSASSGSGTSASSGSGTSASGGSGTSASGTPGLSSSGAGAPGLPASGPAAGSGASGLPSSDPAAASGASGTSGAAGAGAGPNAAPVPNAGGASGAPGSESSASGAGGSGEFPTGSHQQPAPHADAPVAGPAAADLGTATGPGNDAPWGAPPSPDQPSTGEGFPGVQDAQAAAGGAPTGESSPWGAPAASGSSDGDKTGGQPGGAWGAPADAGQAASGDQGTGTGAWGTPGPSSGGDQNPQGETPWGAPPANAGPSQDGFPGVAAQQNAQPPAADGGWGQPPANQDPSAFPGAQGPDAGRQDGAPGQQGPGQQGTGQPEPLLHSDFAWEAAINPVLGGVEQQQDEAQQQAAPPQPQQPAPNPQQQAQQAAAGGPHPADELVRKNVHGDKLGRRLGRGVRKAVGGGSAMTAQQQAAFADLMARPVPSFRQIAIASVRGGAGKTTMAALLASELARHRQDRVVAIDADAELGSLPLRLGLVPQLSLTDLAQASPSTFDEVSRFLSRTSEGLWVLSSTRGGRMSQEFSIQTFQRALSSVSRFVSAAVVDCGAGILTEVNQGIIAQTHALVLVTPGTVDGALSARGALEWFANNGRQHVFQRAVVAMVSHAPQINADLGRAQEMLTAWGLPVVHVPYDRQVATGAALDLDKIGGATRQAATKIVYQAFARSLGLPGVQG
ncbi:nucleotide-binding protein [Actinomadura rupiterrae]|uniref:nucleotide-binding protein n=1 Tax=Actinomadura rupiterrae TaxID=559627 RepID=UPI0020A3843E|nr:AAA family ATPase [Actinomadura rupiterrae]MCP2343612.1 MinD-like ATPase involved in chromosome partitioning or flagellar assembly [Actinomadura rupiterrae]